MRMVESTRHFSALGGNHRTLAFSLGGEGEVLLTAVGPGGYDCVRVDRAWQTVQGRLTSFPGGAEQMWQWPPAGVVSAERLCCSPSFHDTVVQPSEQQFAFNWPHSI